MNMDPEMGTMTHKRVLLVKVAIPGAMISSTENKKEEQSFMVLGQCVKIFVACDIF